MVAGGSGTARAESKPSSAALDPLQEASPPIEYGQIGFLANLSCLPWTYIRAGISGIGTMCGSSNRVPEDAHSQRHRLALMDRGPCPCVPSPHTKISSRSGRTPIRRSLSSKQVKAEYSQPE